MNRTLLYGLILSLLWLNACSGGGDRDEGGETSVKLVLDGKFTGSADTSERQAQASSYSYNLLLKVTAPDFSSPLIFINQNYQPGSVWTVLVPNGPSRVFELIVYTTFNESTYNYFPVYLYVPANSPAERTYDLTGSEITVSIPLTESLTGAVGSGYPATAPKKAKLGKKASLSYDALGMKTPEGVVPIPNCQFTLKAYLLDPEFPGLTIGPALIDMANASYPGEYYLEGIPVNRTYQLRVVRPEMGWQGTSGYFSLPNQESAFKPLTVILTGYQPLDIAPKNFPVKANDSSFSKTLIIQGGWGLELSIWNEQSSYATISQQGSQIEYLASPGGLLDGVSDVIHLLDVCDGNSVQATAYWYKAPKIDYLYSDVICTTGDYVEIYSTGNNFDIPPRDSQFSEIFVDGKYYAPTGGDYTMEDYLWFMAPPKPYGLYTLTVRNKRTNPALPDFNGWEDSAGLGYCECDNMGECKKK